MARLFEAENDKIEQRNRFRGIIASIIFHSALFFVLYLIVGVNSVPPLDKDSSGGFVNLGTMDEGSGPVQPTSTDKDMQVPTPVAATPTPPEKTPEEKVISTNKTDAPVIAKKTEKKIKKEPKVPKIKTPAKPVKAPTPVVPVPPKPKLTYKGGIQNNSTGEGPDSKGGDKGQVIGDPNGTDYKGGPGIGDPGPGGTGGGTRYSLNGRHMMSNPCPIGKPHEAGRIVLRIKVSKDGKIISSEGPYTGSTTTSSYLLGLAKGSLSCVKFDTPANVPDEQFGTITFNFKY